MSASNNINSLIGAATRYIAGRNAMQTVYWRSAPGPNGKMMKYNKTFEFDKSSIRQKLPNSVRFQYYNRSFRAPQKDTPSN